MSSRLPEKHEELSASARFPSVISRLVYAVKMIAVPLTAAALSAMPAEANLITQYDPFYQPVNNRAIIQLEIENTDDGAVYDTYDLHLFNSLAQALYALPQNQTAYDSIEDLTQGWGLTIQSYGEVDAGWTVTPGNYSAASIGNVGGDIDDFYDGWYATQQNPNQDMMALTLSIPLSQLDGNNNGWNSLDSGDYTIAMNTSETPNIGVGHAGFGNDFPAQGYEYNVNIVPEPNTIALLGLGAAALLAARNRRKK